MKAVKSKPADRSRHYGDRFHAILRIFLLLLLLPLVVVVPKYAVSHRADFSYSENSELFVIPEPTLNAIQ